MAAAAAADLLGGLACYQMLSCRTAQRVQRAHSPGPPCWLLDSRGSGGGACRAWLELRGVFSITACTLLCANKQKRPAAAELTPSAWAASFLLFLAMVAGAAKCSK